ncbi:MAG: hydroxyethylthiazole kinase [Methanimicrococcus sp.]|nr:hydroxyethylthiazole kinase [Methanimicrococcus sp.]
MTFHESKYAKNKAMESLIAVKKTVPLVHCITNRVTITDCANGALACGAAPIMSEDLREVEDITAISQALVINIGTLMPLQIEAMLKAGKKAKKLSVPVVFDPVGAGATKLRDEVSKQMIEEVKPDIIRGNMSEIRALYGFAGHTKGVEAAASDAVTMDNAEELSVIVKEMAEKFDCVVAATGEIDILSDGKTVYFVGNGHPMLCKITGSGCVLSVLTGAYAGAAASKSKDGLLESAVGAFVLSGLAGEYAYAGVEKVKGGTGTFHTEYMNALNMIGTDDFKRNAKIYVFEE